MADKAHMSKVPHWPSSRSRWDDPRLVRREPTGASIGHAEDIFRVSFCFIQGRPLELKIVRD